MKRTLFRWGRVVIGLAATAGFLFLAVRGLDWRDVAGSLGGVSIPLLVLAVAVFMLASYVRAVRWRILFTDVDISSARLFIIQNEGIGLNNLVPVRVASEVTQLAVLTLKDGVGKAKALATLGMERVIDVVASTMILAVAFFVVPEMENFTIYVWGAVVFTVVVVALVRFLAWGSDSLAFVRRVSFLAAFTTTVRDLERERLRLLGSYLVSVVYWIMVGIVAWIIAVAADLPMSPVTATLVIMGTIFFATAVPAAPSAIGTFEFAVVYVLEFFGIEREAGFGYAIIIHAVFFLPPTIIAAIFLPLEGVVSFRGKKELAASGAGAHPGSRPPENRPSADENRGGVQAGQET